MRDADIYGSCPHDKGKPAARRGRKATGLQQAARLPKGVGIVKPSIQRFRTRNEPDERRAGGHVKPRIFYSPLEVRVADFRFLVTSVDEGRRRKAALASG